MMAFTRSQVLMSTKGLSTEQLDFLLDAKANRIGALLMHLAAVETFYQLNTFDGVNWGSWPDSIKQRWEVSGGLDEPARKAIQGNHLDYYLNLLTETHEKSLAEFRKRDDKWLMTVDKDWGWGPTNNYCKCFHVAEHESNHNGQIKLIKGRLPGAKSGNEYECSTSGYLAAGASSTTAAPAVPALSSASDDDGRQTKRLPPLRPASRGSRMERLRRI